MRRCIVPAVAVLLSVGLSVAVGAGPLKVKVDVDTVYAINGVDQIQSAVFGVTAYEGAPAPAYPDYQGVLQHSGITCLGFPGVVGWCAPKQLPDDGAPGIEAWYAAEVALHEITNAEPLYGARYMYGQILPGCRKLGIEPMIYILGGPDWVMGEYGIPKNNELYAEVVTGYVGLLKRSDPQLRWVHIGNEPNSVWFRAEKSGQDYADMFKVVARAIKERAPDVMVGGPVLCWPPAFPEGAADIGNWYTWDLYTMPLIRTAGEALDFFDFHYYGLEQDVIAEEIGTVANAMYLERGRRIPVAITECGNYMTGEDLADPTAHYMTRTLGMERLLMLYLDRPATVLTVQIHDLGAGTFRFLKSSDPDDQFPTYDMYSIWRRFRGRRLVASAERGPVKVMAALNGMTVVCMVFNDQNFSREIAVSLVGRPDCTTAEATAQWECIYLDKQANELIRTSGTGSGFRADPYSTYAVLFDLPENWQPTHRAQRLEFFGSSVMNQFQQVGQHLKVSVNIPEPSLADARSTRVRIGLLGSRLSDQMTMTVGTDTYQLASGTYFQEVPLKQVPSPGETTLDFCLLRREGTLGERPAEEQPENQLLVSSVSVVIEK